MSSGSRSGGGGPSERDDEDDEWWAKDPAEELAVLQSDVSNACSWWRWSSSSWRLLPLKNLLLLLAMLKSKRLRPMDAREREGELEREGDERKGNEADARARRGKRGGLDASCCSLCEAETATGRLC
uniref:Uncharacterized protein n=1 Tax=Hyaloperonospora arabidopsidis (strain Emoy2) TaxID=559515 RepID=M4B5B4_HYAAE